MTARAARPLNRVLFWGLIVSLAHGVTTLLLYQTSGWRYNPSGTWTRTFGRLATLSQEILHAPLFLAGLDRAQPWMLRYALFSAESLIYGYCVVLIVWAVRRMLASPSAPAHR